MTVNPTDEKAGKLASIESRGRGSRYRRVRVGLFRGYWETDGSVDNDLRFINTSADAFAIKKVLRTLEMVAKNDCGFCDLGWEFEVKDYGVYHKVPPKNMPTIMKNVKCRAQNIRTLASKIGKGEIEL